MLHGIRQLSMIRAWTGSAAPQGGESMHQSRLTLHVITGLGIFVWLAGCGGSGSSVSPEMGAAPQVSTATGLTPLATGKLKPAPAKPANPIVVLHTTAGDVKIELLAEKAPQTVHNFLQTYASRGFYDQTIFHHVEAGMMLIGGGFTADLQPKTPRTAIFNESRNGLTNRRGTIAMIRDPESPHSATSQFFINLADNPDFDFKAGETEDQLGYCVFAEIVEGFDIVERIAKMPTSAIGEFAKVPSPAVAIQSVERLR
jgi:cyclophilin family peptidyl-prolyl cis-trans isomerase